MFLLPSNPFRSLFLTAAALTILVLFAPAAFAQAAPAGQLPEEIRGAKVYQLPSKGGQPAPNPGVYKSLNFKDINWDRLLLALAISIKPVDRGATVERMYFQDVRVNGIPVHIDTFDQEFKLSSKEMVDLPAPLNCAIVFAELDSMQPVREMVDKDKILITGNSFIEIKLNSLEKVALRAKQVVIPVPLNEEVPLNLFQGNFLLKMTADKILDVLSDPSSAAAVNMAKEHVAKVHLDQTVGEKVKPAVYMLYTEYVVRDPKSKASEKYSLSGTGFLVSADGKLVTSKRVLAPWKFDPQVGFLLEHLQLELDKASVKTYAWPAGSKVMTADGQPDFQSALSTEKQTLKILQMPPDQMVQQDFTDPDSQQKATLHLHAEGEADVALLQLSGTGFKPLSFSDPAATPGPDSKLALCSYPLGMSQPLTAPRLLSVKAELQGTTIKMDHQVDLGESGAPLLNADGAVIALATSTNLCLSIQFARKLMP